MPEGTRQLVSNGQRPPDSVAEVWRWCALLGRRRAPPGTSGCSSISTSSCEPLLPPAAAATPSGATPPCFSSVSSGVLPRGRPTFAGKDSVTRSSGSRDGVLHGGKGKSWERLLCQPLPIPSSGADELSCIAVGSVAGIASSSLSGAHLRQFHHHTCCQVRDYNIPVGRGAPAWGATLSGQRGEAYALAGGCLDGGEAVPPVLVLPARLDTLRQDCRGSTTHDVSQGT